MLPAHHWHMMTQQLGFSIVSAPLAAIDRRTLSQAWYSALHLARDTRIEGEGKRPRETPIATGRSTIAIVVPTTHASVPSPNMRALPEDARRASEGAENVERRAMRSPLARKIERVFLDPRKPVERATFTVDGTGARVHVTLQGSGDRLRLVALCPPSLRIAVTQALVQARYALASRGIDLAFETGGDAC